MIELTGRCIEKARARDRHIDWWGGFRTWLGYGYLGKLMDAREEGGRDADLT